MPRDKWTAKMMRNRKILLELYGRALKDDFPISNHGSSMEIEFFSEIKLMEQFDKKGLPDYIIDG